MRVILQSMWTRFSCGLREDSGSFAIEFAFIASFLVLLMGAIFEGSLLFYTWGNMEHIGRQAARAAAVGEFNQLEAEEFIVSRMSASIGKPNVTASVLYETGPNPIDSEVIVNVTMPATELSRLQPLRLFRLITLSTRVTMHREVSS